MVREALEAGAAIETIFATEQVLSDQSLMDLAHSAGVEVQPVGDAVIGALSETTTPQGVAAIAVSTIEALGSMPEDVNLVLVLHEVRDPGNAGTLIRSAVAAEADAVIFTGSSVDPLGPKTVRASAGALFRTHVITAGLEEALVSLRTAGVNVVGASAGSEMQPEACDLTGRIALVVGNEGWGLPPDVASAMDVTVGIPMPGPAESLNVAVAGSILLYEAVRQRRSLPAL